MEIISQLTAHSSQLTANNYQLSAISYQLSVDSYIKLIVYDIAGREVSRLFDGFQPAGKHQTTFDASGLPSGIYFVRLSAGNNIQTQKIALVK
ncbi:MAG: T9SS type A sorting domain-containing protein [candidate division Zixibacteria bacterium]|nr:T9SS type A sorting domain-containing protein [Candidatus Tariuqbacter arcticus]